MNQCNRTGNELKMCDRMKNETDYGNIFKFVMYLGKERVLVSAATLIDFCPFCGGKLAED